MVDNTNGQLKRKQPFSSHKLPIAVIGGLVFIVAAWLYVKNNRHIVKQNIEVTADIKVNDMDDSVSLTPGSDFVFSWTSSNATACKMTSPTTSGISLSGVSSSITPDHPYYPKADSSVVLGFVCTNGVSNAGDTVVVTR